jgi:cytochrome c7-like protein
MRSERKTSLIIAAAIVLVVTAAGIGWSLAAAPYAPEQPIAFSHRAHVEHDGLHCELCHAAARRSAFAGVPPVERCIGCHRVVLPANPEVAKLQRYYDSGKAIPWVKVYSLPRFVRFNHGAHVRASVACGTCHGEVTAMSRVARVSPLTMGWCVGCHRDSHASDDCLTCHY